MGVKHKYLEGNWTVSVHLVKKKSSRFTSSAYDFPSHGPSQSPQHELFPMEWALESIGNYFFAPKTIMPLLYQ